MQEHRNYEQGIQSIQIQLILTDQISLESRGYACRIQYQKSTNTIKIGGVISRVAASLKSNQLKLFLKDYVNRTKTYLGTYPSIRTDIWVDARNLVENQLEIYHAAVEPNEDPLNLEKCDIQSVDTQDNLKLDKSDIRKQTKQRCIAQTLKMVRLWRKLYDTPDQTGSKRLYTLDEAAQKVGIPKRSLEDYFIKIRQASEYNLNFKRLQNQKFGLVRRLLKNIKEEGYEKAKEKYPEYIGIQNSSQGFDII